MSTPSTELAKTKEKFQSVRDLFFSRQSEIAASLPSHLDERRMIQVALGALRTNPALLDCTQSSLLSAVMSACQLGLELDGVLGQAYLVPYGRDVTLQIGYRGMLELARRSGQIKSVSARVVRRDDIFSYQYGAREELTHIPKSAPDAEITHVYAVARFKDGGFAMEVLSKIDVEAIRKSAKAGQRGPWVSHWSSMARKTAIRQLFKYLPTSTQIVRAVQIDELGEQGISLHGAEIITEDGEVISDPVQSGTVDVAAIAEAFGAEHDNG